MRVELSVAGVVRWQGRALAVHPAASLLGAVARDGSVRAAAERLGVSYRSAWGRMAELEETLGRPVAIKTKGHGTALTPFGLSLLASLEAALSALDAPLAREAVALETRLAQLLEAPPARLRVAASHDPSLLAVLGRREDVELSVVGSEAALRRLERGEADVAGCHFGPAEGVPPPLQAAGLVADAAFEREQGLVVASGNPLKLRSIADLARRGVRFINRQRGSGTRAWIDRALAEAAIAPARVAGYAIEEFTHHAVAAVVASGAADAGVAVRAAADAFGLGFVPLGRETYYLVRRDEGAAGFVREVADALRAASEPELRGVKRRSGSARSRSR